MCVYVCSHAAPPATAGAIITSLTAASFPTAIVYVFDTPRAASSPTTFASNMLYACSVMYKSRVPFLLAANKVDVQDAGKSSPAAPIPRSPHARTHSCRTGICLQWLRDWSTFEASLAQLRNNHDGTCVACARAHVVRTHPPVTRARA